MKARISSKGILNILSAKEQKTEQSQQKVYLPKGGTGYDQACFLGTELYHTGRKDMGGECV